MKRKGKTENRFFLFHILNLLILLYSCLNYILYKCIVLITSCKEGNTRTSTSFTRIKKITENKFRLFFYLNYSITPVTTPDPTVLPPSRIANLNPSSIAIGVISLIVIFILSPGIIISVPAGSSATPVTSVVLK